MPEGKFKSFLSLFRELGEDCVRCLKKRKAFLDIAEGPLPEENLTISPPFWVAMCDLYGPCHIFVPGHAHKTRHRNIVEAKCCACDCRPCHKVGEPPSD